MLKFQRSVHYWGLECCRYTQLHSEWVTNKQSTVTLAAHARRGLMKLAVLPGIVKWHTCIYWTQYPLFKVQCQQTGYLLNTHQHHILPPQWGTAPSLCYHTDKQGEGVSGHNHPWRLCVVCVSVSVCLWLNLGEGEDIRHMHVPLRICALIVPKMKLYMYSEVRK